MLTCEVAAAKRVADAAEENKINAHGAYERGDTGMKWIIACEAARMAKEKWTHVSDQRKSCITRYDESLQARNAHDHAAAAAKTAPKPPTTTAVPGATRTADAD
jgi:hypothetical protein